MVRAAAARVSAHAVLRVLVAVLLLLLLLSLDGVLPGRVDAGHPRGSAIAIRQRQVRAQSAMRRADAQIRRLERRHDAQAKRLHQARRRLDRSEARTHATRRRAGGARDVLATERAVRDRMLRVHPNPTGRQRPDRPTLRRRVARLQARFDRLDDRLTRLKRLTERARRVTAARARNAGRARIEARKQAREGAESRLASQIGLMLALSKDRAAAHASADLRRGFARPARGTISQGYGCQPRHPAKRSQERCGRFHDGIDIATRRGTTVRASADGYVAYVGWNPWDRGRRAFVVIIGHARGLETVYAHLAPVHRVKAGQPVERGQAIGVVGLTGRTSGAHVHWEVSRDFRSMDPLLAGR
jgi:murein DD-endopeptidase MepM/ murein hydrolase activator NlpD